MAMPERIEIEVAFALPDRQEIETLEIDAGGTVADALQRSTLPGRFSEIDFQALQVGVWGRVVRRDHILQEGDRLEVYRPLERDPKETRRELARAQRLGSSS
jgi:putative ubiquitin-RnfH superfamily antitoxin RatB of RatAB toxin-antitoxin module